MTTDATSQLLLVDGHAYAYRAFHAIRHLNSPAGAPTNAIFGFIKMLGKMQTQLAPSHLAVVWDGGLAAERVASLPEYKAHRPPMPPDLDRQIGAIQDYLAAARVASLCLDGVEADDLIATLARQATVEGAFVIIASSDKDFMQLVSPQLGLLNPHDKSEKVWTAAEVRAKTGVAPEQIVDWLSLVGDGVDNIAGVPGVGEKTAAQLLNQFGSVETLARRLAEVKSDKLRTSLQGALDTVGRNQRLVRLNDAVPGEFTLDALRAQPPDPAKLRPLFAEWGFKTLLSQLEETPQLL
jgi:DNA polymerase-1